MSRPHVVVRRVEESLQGTVLDLWTACLAESGTTGEAAARLVLESRVGALLAREDVAAFAAFADGEPVGYLLLTDTTGTALLDGGGVTVDQLYVLKSARRHGVARQLLTAVITYADRVGTDQLVTNVPTQGRDANRFFARLGFTPTVVRRVTTTAALRRRLAGNESRYSVDQLLQRRRTARLRAAGPAAPAGRG